MPTATGIKLIKLLRCFPLQSPVSTMPRHAPGGLPDLPVDRLMIHPALRDKRLPGTQALLGTGDSTNKITRRPHTRCWCFGGENRL